MAWSYEGMSLAEAWRSADDIAEDDERFMRAALEQAKRAACEGRGAYRCRGGVPG